MDSLTDAREMLVYPDRTYSAGEYRALVERLVNDLDRAQKALRTVRRGLRVGKVKSQPIICFDPMSGASEFLEDILDAALSTGRSDQEQAK